MNHEGTSVHVSGHTDEAEMMWLHAARGQVIRLTLIDGKTLVGQLLSADLGALVVQGSGAAPLLVYKHGVAYVAVEEQREAS